MRILFWNTHKNKEINEYLIDLCREYCVGLLVLAEYDDSNDNNLQKELGYIKHITNGCDRIWMYGNYIDVEPGIQNRYYSCQIINGLLIVCGVHLMSDMYSSSEKRASITRQLSQDIRELSEELHTNNVLIVGDMNCMPYSGECMSADTLHGLPMYEEGKKEFRKINSCMYRKYYNPTWNWFGDFEYPPGTYHYSGSDLLEPGWHIMDQFIVDYGLASRIDKEKCFIITRCGSQNLYDKNGYPRCDISDHFPIFCELKGFDSVS